MVAVAKDALTAESWQQLLEDAHVLAEIRMADPAIAGMPSAAARWFGNPTPIPALVSYSLYVQARDRRVARSVLAQSPELNGPNIDRNTVLGAVAVVGATMIGVLVILLRG